MKINVFTWKPLKLILLLLITLMFYKFLLALLIFMQSPMTIAAPIWTMVNCNASNAQGDCHVLDDDGQISMVDAGTETLASQYLIPYLKKKNIRTVENFFISHPHTDHYAGIGVLIDEGIRIKNIYFNKPPVGVSDFDYKPEQFEALLSRAIASGVKLHNVEKGDTIKLKNTVMNVLEAVKTVQIGGVNDYSILMRWDAGGYTTLFTGDLNKPLSQTLEGDMRFSADFMKVAHHGVTGVATNRFSNTVNPLLTMIPQPRILWNHSRGHQVRDWAKDRYSSSGMYTCTNGFNGTVSISFEQTSVVLMPEVPSQLCPSIRLQVTPKEVLQISKIKVDALNSILPLTILD